MRIQIVSFILVLNSSLHVQQILGNTVCGIMSPCDSVNCIRYEKTKSESQTRGLKIRIEELGNVTEVILDCNNLKKTIRIGDSTTKDFPQPDCKVHYDSISHALKNVLPGRYVETCCERKDSSDVAKDFDRIKIGINENIYETDFQCEKGGDIDTSKYKADYTIFKDVQEYVVKYLLKNPNRNLK